PRQALRRGGTKTTSCRTADSIERNSTPCFHCCSPSWTFPDRKLHSSFGRGRPMTTLSSCVTFMPPLVSPPCPAATWRANHSVLIPAASAFASHWLLLRRSARRLPNASSNSAPLLPSGTQINEPNTRSHNRACMGRPCHPHPLRRACRNSQRSRRRHRIIGPGQTAGGREGERSVARQSVGQESGATVLPSAGKSRDGRGQLAFL